MSAQALAAAALRLRIALAPHGIAVGALVAVLLAAGVLAWLVPQRMLQADQHRIAMRLATMPVTTQGAATPYVANDNLALFYRSLGEQRYAEQQVRTLFALAAKAGLSLNKGEYRAGYERSARLHTYQITLPVKGSYNAVWNFAMMSLRAIPFASLDDISFKRDSIGDTEVEARLRLTLYLAGQPGPLP